jgi:6-phosphogluconolactonase
MQSLRIFVLAAVSLLGGCATLDDERGAKAGGQLHVFVSSRAGTPGTGVHHLWLDRGTGALSDGSLVAEQSKPMWLSLFAGNLLAAGTSGDAAAQGEIVRYRIDPGSGGLERLQAVPSGGSSPTYLAWSSSTGALYVAHYASGSVGRLTYSMQAGLGGPAQSVKHSGSGPHERQKSPHAHAAVIAPDGHFLLVPDLGTDRVHVYPIDARTGALDEAARRDIAFPPGSGPRHLVFTPDKRRLIVNLELAGAIQVLAWDAWSGTAQTLSEIALDPADFAGRRSAAALAVSSDGRHVYASNRGRNVLQVFELDREARLREVQAIPSGGEVPWAFEFADSGRWLLVANEGSGAVCSFAVSNGGAALRPTGSCVAIPKPVALAVSPSTG